ncbi:MAG: 50S ribosomal protein L13 [Crocinitomicaceae bacterium]|nr:50S ribosomal protein L13 [Crocinitomicaceae bacterium]
MDAVSYKTKYANSETSDKKWLVVDAEGQSLGRLASKVAYVIRGKHKPSYTPHADCGDNVIVINADKVMLSGNKLEDKDYIRHTGYPGGQRILSVKEMFDKHPERVVEKAVKGMLPGNKLGNKLYRNLRVVVGSEHNMEAQKPETLDLNTIKE